MKSFKIKVASGFNIEISDIASDKSISHRCSILSLLSDKPSIIENYLRAEDTLNTLKIVEKLGAVIEDDGNIIKITPPQTLKEPDDVLDCGNSGTAIRLLCGFLAPVDGLFILSGDKYLRQRPMGRVINPLISIGAKIDGRENAKLAPIVIRGSQLSPFNYHSNISSAQVKSALILSALRSDGISVYSENELSRDHTERMLKGMGGEIELVDGEIHIHPLKKPLSPLNIRVPSDPSSAFFFAVACAISKNSSILIKNVTLNKTRIEAFEVLKRMGAKISYIEKENIYEPIGDIIVESGELRGVEVKDNISWLIDELPALSIAMACANGESIVKNAKELRVKESDRIKSVVLNLRLCGIEVEEFEDGYKIVGGAIKSAIINSFGDHRIAMSFAIAGIVSGMEIVDTECILTSFPNFVDILNRISEIDGEWK